jgi:hypothetical protein
MKEYFKSNIQYYLRHLQQSGCLDPVREIATDFTDYLKEYLTDEQKKYIKTNTQDRDKKIISDVLILIKTMKANNKVDPKILKLIEEGLSSLI